MENEAELRRRIAAVPHWHHIIELSPGVFTPGVYDCRALLAMLELPADLRGKRALDIGARDGFFSFELERRGAEVLAVDYLPADETGFATVKDIRRSRVTYLHENLFNLKPESVGRFEVVLFLGVLYHLRNPLLALDLIRELCTDRLYLETHVCDQEIATEHPIMRFYPRDSLAGDFTNYWGPNTACVRGMIEEARFAVRRCFRNHDRSVFECQTVDDSAIEYYTRISRSRILQGSPVG